MCLARDLIRVYKAKTHCSRKDLLLFCFVLITVSQLQSPEENYFAPREAIIYLRQVHRFFHPVAS